MRDGAAKDLNVTLGSLPSDDQMASAESPAPASPDAVPSLGLEFSALTPDIRDQLQVPADEQGIVVARSIPTRLRRRKVSTAVTC